MSTPPPFDLFAETRRALLDALARTEQQAQTYTAEMVQQTEQRARQRLAEIGQRGAELERRASELTTALAGLRDQIDQIVQGLAAIREQASALEQETRATVRLSPLADEGRARRPEGGVGHEPIAPSWTPRDGGSPAGLAAERTVRAQAGEAHVRPVPTGDTPTGGVQSEDRHAAEGGAEEQYAAQGQAAEAQLQGDWGWRPPRAEPAAPPSPGAAGNATQETLRYLRESLGSLDAAPSERPPSNQP